MIRLLASTGILVVASFWLGDAAGLAPVTEFFLAGIVSLGGCVAAAILAARHPSVARWLLAAALAALTLVCAAAVLVELSGLE